MMSDADRLSRLLRSRHPCVFIATHEEDEALEAAREAAMGQSQDVLLWSVDEGLRNAVIEGDPPILETEHPAAALMHLTRLKRGCVIIMLDLADHLSDARTLRTLRRAVATMRDLGGTLVLIDHEDTLPAVVRSHATRFNLSLPDEEEIEEIVRREVRKEHRNHPVEVQLTRGDLDAIVRNLRGLSRRRIERIVLEMIAEDRKFDADDVVRVLAQKRQLLEGAGLLEFVEAPASLDEVGGLSRLKDWLELREGAMSKRAAEYGLRAPRGVLLLGVQGAGKSLSAKAIATAWRRPLLRLDPGSLFDRFIGESERRLRDALHQAEAMSPIVLWIDEIEKGFASAAAHSTDGGLSKRMFGTLLTWMQEHEAPVFLVATANDIEALPPELLRKGRFDEIFFVDLPDDGARRTIFDIHLRRRRQDPAQFDLDALVKASDGYSGAEIEHAIVAALHEAFAANSMLSTQMVEQAIGASPPLSVTMRERVDSLRRWAQGRCVPAD